MTSTSTTVTAALASSTNGTRPPSGKQSSETIDFARIAVLFILQETGQIKTAVQAQANIRELLEHPLNKTQTESVGSDEVELTLNLANFSIALGNGTEVGGQGNGDGGFKDVKR